ncbi:NAD(P)-binding domain-containing protein [Pseudoalteromonas luteoviolacea]|uniref:Pyridine nucleotide-disulfide oxidoreductase n=1 Tax=Pseudoalteromonas luteoviolacea H33 TaxID=1365251 RepID=A0A161XZA0_9GAMM|nr:NAD(P)-binding domain-containing protein [Pseudoalteromonas luteoviolacea]KZN48729.1 hypothetical protein N476_21175 [Pseudoalteromonas luteoviolacea H33]KZN75436.1 hypothetical protein N477_01610 [Pseudoalteromonas luteoviolacea H33-S]MBQ4878635.1 NAD(P)-binding domain-containing protein [Pseudoalteromonas luteoviolacea]MBQ4907175.1 NAD(P)-binding domain-containing protein [Pseudoalteromonas luteoviolacea]
MVVEHDYVIIGGGPAGLQLGYFFSRDLKNYLILEKADKAGAYFDKYPVHRKLISINKVYTGFDCFNINLRWDWNSLLSEKELSFKEYSEEYFPKADRMVDYLNDYAKVNELNIRYNSDVVKVSKKEGIFYITLADGDQIKTKNLVVATGLSEERVPNVSGIEHAVTYGEHSLELDKYKNKRVMILGKGNSAFETADHLNDVTASIHLLSPNPVKLAWSTHYVGNLRAVNNNVLDTYQLKSQNTILDGEVEKITKAGDSLLVDVKYTHAEGQRIQVPVDEIIICAGFKFSNKIFDETCMPEMCSMDKYPSMTSDWESTSVSNMYFAGTITHSRDYKKSFSGFIHGFRYNAKLLNSVLNEKNHEKPFPSYKVDYSSFSLHDALIKRIHENSSLFQQPGFICDYIRVNSDKGFEYIEDLSLDIIKQREHLSSGRYLTVTMEYGDAKHPDPFNIHRTPENGKESAFIHPVIRLFDEGSLKAECHIPEDLENNWYQDMYQDILYRFICEELALAPVEDARAVPTIDYLNKVTKVL